MHAGVSAAQQHKPSHYAISTHPLLGLEARGRLQEPPRLLREAPPRQAPQLELQAAAHPGAPVDRGRRHAAAWCVREQQEGEEEEETPPLALAHARRPIRSRVCAARCCSRCQRDEEAQARVEPLLPASLSLCVQVGVGLFAKRGAAMSKCSKELEH